MGENERRISLGEIFLALVFFISFLSLFLFLNTFFLYLSDFLGFKKKFLLRLTLIFSVSIQTLLMLLLAYFFGARKLGWRGLGISSFNFSRALLWGGGSYFLFLFFEILMNMFFLKVFGRPLPSSQEVKMIFGSGWSSFFLATFFAGVLAPVVEEIFFRGFIYTALKSHWGSVKAMIVSSLIFSFFHFNPLIFPVIFLLGLILSFLYEKAGSLDASICLHILNNVLAMVLIYSHLWRSVV